MRKLGKPEKKPSLRERVHTQEVKTAPSALAGDQKTHLLSSLRLLYDKHEARIISEIDRDTDREMKEEQETRRKKLAKHRESWRAIRGQVAWLNYRIVHFKRSTGINVLAHGNTKIALVSPDARPRDRYTVRAEVQQKNRLRRNALHTLYWEFRGKVLFQTEKTWGEFLEKADRAMGKV